MDKVFKKIVEGLEIFDNLYERHESASNSSQKEKLENDLKKEIKKLQRFREQVKNWQTANDIKDKNQLLEHRHLVEVAMEKYKVVEKGSKTKAYSDQSLAAADEPEIDNEAIEFVRQSLDTLQQQTESLEAEIEKLQPGKKAKKNIHNEELKKDYEELLSSHQWHTEKLEIILRLLQNEILSVEDIMNLSDDISYYLDENKSPDFVFDDTIYDELDLEAEQDLINDIHVIPEEPTITPSAKESSLVPEPTRSRSIQPISNSNSRSNSIPNVPSTKLSTSSSSFNSKPDTHEKPPVIQSIGTSSTNQATVTTLKPAPVLALTSEINWSSVVTAAKKKDSSPQPSNNVNTNAMNAASVLEALKKQKPNDIQVAESSGDNKIDNNNSNINKTNDVYVNATSQIESNKIGGEKHQAEEEKEKQISIKDSTQNTFVSDGNNEQNNDLRSESLLENSNLNTTSISNFNGNIFQSGTSSISTNINIQPSAAFTKTQSLAAATDKFRFLPPGIQSFVLSISLSKDISNSVYNPFLSINHTPNRTYPTGLKAIHLAESWNKVKTAKDLSVAISGLEDDLLFFGYYYSKSNEERSVSLEVLLNKGWKQSKGGVNWYLPKSITSKNDDLNISDYSVFNVDKWTITDVKNIKLDNTEFV
ncbi:hypothetical protein C6P42_003798 [Pichia californica]|nr:hypothetical protein C6P42_003798 [[Candida] californica]